MKISIRACKDLTKISLVQVDNVIRKFFEIP